MMFSTSTLSSRTSAPSCGCVPGPDCVIVLCSPPLPGTEAELPYHAAAMVLNALQVVLHPAMITASRSAVQRNFQCTHALPAGLHQLQPRPASSYTPCCVVSHTGTVAPQQQHVLQTPVV